MEVLDEITDLQRPLIVAEGHRVHSQACLEKDLSPGFDVCKGWTYELVDQADECLQVLLYAEVESIAVL